MVASGGSGGYRDAHATPGVGAVALDLPVQVEGLDAGAGLEGGLVDELGGDQPRDLELDAVGILGVQGFGGAVVAGADEGADLAQLGGEALELTQCVDLPGQVVEADRLATGAGWTNALTDGEESEVVVVRRPRRLHEHRLVEALDHVDAPEPQHLLVEGGTALRVPDVEDGVVQAGHGHT